MFCFSQLQANATGKITYGVMVFASNVKILISPEKVQTVHTVKKKIKNVYITRGMLRFGSSGLFFIGIETNTFPVPCISFIRYVAKQWFPNRIVHP